MWDLRSWLPHIGIGALRYVGTLIAGGVCLMLGFTPEWVATQLAAPWLYDLRFRTALVVAGIFLFVLAISWDRFRYKRVRDWSEIDQSHRFKLGQWAALIKGYDYLPPEDDPQSRPWRNEFFRLKGDLERRVFKAKMHTKKRRPNRHLIVYRAEIQAYFKKHRSDRPRAVFPPLKE